MCSSRKRFACAAVLTWSIWFLTSPAVAVAQDMTTGLFDKPIKTKIVSIAHDGPHQQAATVKCSYFPSFVVEEVHYVGDEGESIFTALTDKGSNPPCGDPEASNPKAVADLYGYLVGVKHDLVVTVLPDTFDGGSGFTIFRPFDHKIVFSSWALVDDKNRLRLESIEESKSGLLVHYNRIFLGPCSVGGQGTTCFDKFVSLTGIDNRYFTRCATDYRQLEEEELRWECTRSGLLDKGCVERSTPLEQKSLNADPTVVAYDVRVFVPAIQPSYQNTFSALYTSIGDRLPVTGRTAVGDLIKCFPAD